jgi:hypothetical protein
MDLNRSDLFNCVFGDIRENFFDRNEQSLLYTHNYNFFKSLILHFHGVIKLSEIGAIRVT